MANLLGIQKSRTRVLLLCQTIVLMFITPIIAFAAGGIMSGSGTEADPFLVEDYADLKVVGTTTTYSLSAVYRLTMDIDASPSATENGGSGFVPIGTYATPFIGVFHGAGHIIKNLTINLTTSTWYVGLFGVSNGPIDGLGLSGGIVSGGTDVGSLVGITRGTVSGCYSTGSVRGTSNVGGLAGYISGTSMDRCYATGSVSGNSSVGGLVGYIYFGAVSKSYATGTVSGSNWYIGGLVGTNGNFGSSTVSECYATGSVSSNYYVGGLVGHNSGGTVSRSYATGLVSGTNYIGGLVGLNESSSTVSTCYWNTMTTGVANGIGYNNGTQSITGLTTTQMKDTLNFNFGYSFSTIWAIRADSTYPGLLTLDNAPFAFADTFSTSRTFSLSKLLLNDCDIETMRSNLTLHVISASRGITDSVSVLTFPDSIARGAISTVNYRIGEIRAADTLWGNIAVAIINFNMMEGSGTGADPYLVETYDDLKNISTIHGLDKVYVLVADIDASPSASENSGAGFVPIGTEGSHFTGTFHGRGHVVKHLTINRPSTNGVALFGWNNGTIDSLGVMDGSITGYSFHTGCLAGWSKGMVKACYATGSVTGSQFVGCLVGTNGDGGTVSDCYATGSVVASNGCAGGLVGYNINSNSTVIRCYATGPVRDNSSNGAGGLVGYNSNGGIVSQSYASGYVTAPGRVGGLVGWNSVSTVNTSYWNTETSGQASGCGQNNGSFSATGLSTNQMKVSSNFSGWDFSSTWKIRADSTYPGLRAVDNAPFAFADTFLTGRTFILSQLFQNDCDIETMRNNLALKVISASRGITDSISILTFPDSIAPGTVSIVKYRVGEIRTADTLWGNSTSAIITIDSIPPSTPQNLAVTDSASHTITIKWQKNTEEDFWLYRIYQGTSPNPTVKIDSMMGGIADTAKTFIGLVDGTRYYFRVTAIDSVGNESGYSNEVNATPADRIAPDTPQNLVVTDSSSQTIRIVWQKNTESDFMLYRIYCDTIPNPIMKIDSTTGGIEDTTKTFSGLINGTRYYFRVTAIDSVGNESGYSNEVNVVPADRVAPDIPQNLVITDSSSQTITIKWHRSIEVDFMLYRIYCNTIPNPTIKVDSMIAGITDTTKIFTELVNGTRYYFRVTAIDSAGNESGYSNEVDAVPADRIAPDEPQNLVVTDSTSQTITIKWCRNTEVDFMLYRIYCDTVPNPTTKVDSTVGGITDTAKTFTGLVNGIRYYLRVTAADSARNESGFSNEVNAIPADRIAPAVPQTLAVIDSSNQSITIKWHKNVNTDFMLYRIYRATSPGPSIKIDSSIGGNSDTLKIYNGLSVGIRYYFRVTAVDSAGNESDYSNEVDAVPQTDIIFEDGSLYSAPISLANTNDNPVGRFKLTAGANGATLLSVKVTFSGSFSGVTSVKLWSSIDSVIGADSRLDSVAYSGSTISLSGNASAIDTGGIYYFVTIDLGASTGNIAAKITSNDEITIAAGTLTETFSDAPLAGNSSIITHVDNSGELTLKVFALKQNYPNPFNPATTIEFTLAERGNVTLKVFDMLGREVATLVDGELNAGVLYKETFDASKLSSGIYIYRLKTEKSSLVRKLMLMK